MEIRAAPRRGARFSQGRLAPFQGACRNHSLPVVFAALRPPATLSQTFGLHGRSFITLTQVSHISISLFAGISKAIVCLYTFRRSAAMMQFTSFRSLIEPLLRQRLKSV